MNKDAILNKIRKLLAMTTENGASEAEALKAAEVAGKLMDEYNISIGETEIKKTGCVAVRFDIGKRRHDVYFMATQVAQYFDCKVWSCLGRNAGYLTFFGLPEDADMCIKMMQLLKVSMESDFAIYMKNDRISAIHGSTLRKSFFAGWIGRVRNRMAEMKASRNTTKTNTGNALVVVKNEVVTSAYAEFTKAMKFRTNKVKISARDHHAFTMGQRAGSNVALGNKMVK